MKMSAWQSALQSKAAWDIGRQGKRHFGGRRYLPRKAGVTEDERTVQAALKEMGISGGCWKSIMRAQLPGSYTANGFRTLEA